MDWADEHYVKLFTRDTVTWRSWPWQARALLPLLMRKVDAAGFFDVGTRDPARSVAIMVELPIEVVTPGLEALLADGTAEMVGGKLLLPKFVDAQESKKTNRAAAREYREKKKALARSNASNPQDSTVIARHEPSPVVTERHPSALPCPSPALPKGVEAAPAAAPREVIALAVTPPDTPPGTWSADDFWRWAQSKRMRAGLVAETRRPDPRALSSWYSGALATLGGEVERLQEAFYRFGDDKHWQAATPPLPFRAFMTQWDSFVPRRVNAGT